MCGIVGYIGSKQASPVLLEGLERLSYRGYDSAGVAVIGPEGRISVRKAKGRLENLKSLLAQSPVEGVIGIGHTRWATHGEPSDLNAHPHTDVKGGIAVVHNGIIENHESLRRYLESTGARFVSQTDTEVIAHLLNHLYEGDMRRALLRAMGMLEGSYALGVICDQEPDVLYCARNDSPLVIGAKDGEGFIASDIPALLSHTRDVIFLQDREIGVLDRRGISVYDAYGKTRQHAVFHVDWDLSSAEKGGYAHYMLKEIHEQPTALQSTFTPRAGTPGEYGWLPVTREEARALRKISIVACGTAYHAGVVGKYAIERLARVPVEAEIASEYRYRDPIIGENELFIAVSQSGETADTLAALREAKRAGCRVLSIVNVVGSTIANESDDVIYTWAGPEISVASTKAYSTQLAVIYLLTLYIGEKLGRLSAEELDRYIDELQQIPELIEKMLAHKENIQFFASRYFNAGDMYFIGRNVDYAASLEASLKLKEISYIHSEAYAAGELKHGPISLIEDGTLVIALATDGRLFDKMMSNIREVKARGAVVLGLATEDRTEIAEQTDMVFYIPKISPFMLPSLSVIPMQLFAYYVASMKGCDIDKPRNLAKSVTVE